MKAPRRPRTTLSHLDRMSALTILAQISLGGFFALLIAYAIGVIGSSYLWPNPMGPLDFLMSVLFPVAALFLFNVLGLAMWRLFTFIRLRIARRRQT